MFKNIIRVTFANIVKFGSSFVVGFILPAVLSVASYGYYKEYTLYLSFVYLFNMGFNDGIYIKYGGEDPENVDLEEVHTEHNHVLAFQLIVFLLLFGFSLIRLDFVLMLFSVVTFFATMDTYHGNFLQATGDFKTFSNGNIMKSFIFIMLLLVGVFLLRSESHYVYIAFNILSFASIFVFYELKFMKRFGSKISFSKEGKWKLYKVGFFILIANMSLTFMGNVGAWVVNFAFPIEDFAYYAFQNSILNILILIVNSVGLVFYNIIAKHEDAEMLVFTKNVSVLLGVLGGLGYFVFYIVIQLFLPQYNQALPILAATFISVPYIMVSKILISNIYKSRKNENKYFRDTFTMAIASIFIVGGTYLLTRDMVAIALATAVSYIIWFIYTTGIEYKYLKSDLREIIILTTHIIIFFLAAVQFNLVTGAITYLIYSIFVLFMYKDVLKKIAFYSKV